MARSRLAAADASAAPRGADRAPIKSHTPSIVRHTSRHARDPLCPKLSTDHLPAFLDSHTIWNLSSTTPLATHHLHHVAAPDLVLIRMMPQFLSLTISNSFMLLFLPLILFAATSSFPLSSSIQTSVTLLATTLQLLQLFHFHHRPLHVTHLACALFSTLATVFNTSYM